MKFNVEMDKKELSKFLNKPNPFFIFMKNFGKAIKKFKWKSTPVSLFILFMAIVGMIIVGFVSYDVGTDEGFNEGYRAAKSIQATETNNERFEYFKDKSFLETASWFGKVLMINIIGNLPILFIIIAMSWILHGVGFRII